MGNQHDLTHENGKLNAPARIAEIPDELLGTFCFLHDDIIGLYESLIRLLQRFTILTRQPNDLRQTLRCGDSGSEHRSDARDKLDPNDRVSRQVPGLSDRTPATAPPNGRPETFATIR